MSDEMGSAAPAAADTGNADSGAPNETNETQAQATGDAQAKAEQKAAERRKAKIKVDGQEQEVEYTDDDVAEALQWKTAAQKRMAEAREAQKKAKQIEEFLKTNPRKALELAGLDIRKFTEEYLAEAIQYDQMDEKDRRLLEQEKKLKAIEDEKKRAEEEQKQHAIRKQAEQAWQQYQSEFTSAMKETGLPDTPATRFRIAEIMKLNLDEESGIELTAKQAARVVRDELRALVADVLNGIGDPELPDWLGKDFSARVRKSELAQLEAKKRAPPSAKPAGMPQRGAPNGEKRAPLSEDDFKARLSRIMKG